jgi:ferritin-like protein
MKQDSNECRDKCMPAEIVDVEKFITLSDHAEYCAMKRLKDVVKLKLRTPSKLYTLKVEPLKAQEVIKKLQCEIREL